MTTSSERAASLRKKLRAAMALMDGATTDGEREAARLACERLRAAGAVYDAPREQKARRSQPKGTKRPAAANPSRQSPGDYPRPSPISNPQGAFGFMFWEFFNGTDAAFGVKCPLCGRTVLSGEAHHCSTGKRSRSKSTPNPAYREAYPK